MILSFFNTPPETILIIFAIAELCDAFDGPCSRRWHYPDDGKYRWWREYCEWTDKGTDLMAGASLIVYITVHLDRNFGAIIFYLCLLIGVSIQFIVYELKGHGYNLKAKNPRIALKLVVIRRFIYGFSIFLTLGYLLIKTAWPGAIKYLLTVVTTIIGLILLHAKGHRLREW